MTKRQVLEARSSDCVSDLWGHAGTPYGAVLSGLNELDHPLLGFSKNNGK